MQEEMLDSQLLQQLIGIKKKCSESEKPTLSQSLHNSPTGCCTFHRVRVQNMIAQNWKSIWIHRKKTGQFSLLKFYSISAFMDKYKAWHTFIHGEFLRGRRKGDMEDSMKSPSTEQQKSLLLPLWKAAWTLKLRLKQLAGVCTWKGLICKLYKNSRSAGQDPDVTVPAIFYHSL